MADTLFSHLVFHFATHPENLATDGLAYILSRSRPATEALRALAHDFAVELPAGLTYQSQATAEDGSRPDLIGGAPEAPPIVIEVKFWAGLTESQPVRYLARLDKKGGLLLVVAPAARLQTLWHELIRRCRADASLSFEEHPSGVKGAWLAEVGLGRRMALVSWATLLDRIRVAAGGDSSTVDDLAQLRGVCDRMDREAFLPVTSYELTTHVFKRVEQFGLMIDKVTDRLVQKGVVSKKGFRTSSGAGYHGRYLSMRGLGVFLVCDTRKWMKYASTPMWLSVYGRRWVEKEPVVRAFAALAQQTPTGVFTAADGFPTVPLFVTPGREESEVVDHLVAQVEEVAALLAPVWETSSEEPGEPPPELPPR